SPAFGPSRSTVTTSSGLPAAYAMAALVFMGKCSGFQEPHHGWGTSLAADLVEAAGCRGQRHLRGAVVPIRNSPLRRCTGFDARGSGVAEHGIIRPARARGGLQCCSQSAVTP